MYCLVAKKKKFSCNIEIFTEIYVSVILQLAVYILLWLKLLYFRQYSFFIKSFAISSIDFIPILLSDIIKSSIILFRFLINSIIPFSLKLLSDISCLQINYTNLDISSFPRDLLFAIA